MILSINPAIQLSVAYYSINKTSW